MKPVSYSYDNAFMDYADQSSRHSAARVTSILYQSLPITSVLDIGCAKGTWLNAWRDQGVTDIQGVDGVYIDREKLVIPRDRFLAHDLSQPLDLCRRFELVQSLEVAEHIDAGSARIFVGNLTRHSSGGVLFSAAPPGQGGENHINEKPYEYWRGIFDELGFEAYDFIRPLILNDPTLSFWYRYNTFLYFSSCLRSSLPQEIVKSRIDKTRRIQDVSPYSFQLRKAIVGLLPDHTRNSLARFKAKFLRSGRW